MTTPRLIEIAIFAGHDILLEHEDDSSTVGRLKCILAHSKDFPPCLVAVIQEALDCAVYFGVQ